MPVAMVHTASVVIPDPSEVNQPMPLYLLSKEMSTDRGAVCLDGTPPGFYASFNNNSGSATSWILYFKGGAWCYNEASCASRAKGHLGSSDHFTPTFEFSGMMDSTFTVNPTFHNYNRVVLYYCDGASFSGNRDEPYVYKKTNQTLYFRGARVLDAMLDTLIQDHGLGKATDVLVSGGSAGGLAAYLHADHVKEYLQAKGAPLKRFKAAPLSGFFLMHEASTGELVYPNQMKYVFDMQNSSSGVNSNCLASYASRPLDAWRCIFANESYAHSKTLMFPLGSALDSWQMRNIWKGDTTCAKSNFAKCTSEEVGHLNGYLSDFMKDLQASEKFSKAGEGGFVESCLEHCGAQNAYGFDNYLVKNVKMRDALATWWNSDGAQLATDHWYLPCSLSIDAPHQCNPSCVSSSGHRRLE